MTETAESSTTGDTAVAAFWDVAKHRTNMVGVPGYFGPTPVESVPPPTWSFGGTPEQADELLHLVLGGIKTATASALWDYEAEGQALPEPGTLGIVLDGAGRPRALVMTTEISVVRFDEVEEEHARLEGEGDLSLAHWREVHEQLFTEFAAHDRGFGPDLPVVLERFRLLYQA